MHCARVVALVCLLLAPAPVALAQTPPTRVGVLLDGPSTYNRTVLEALQREVAAFFGADRAVEFPPRLIREGNWTPAGVQAALDLLLADREVAVVIALGPMGSHELARRRTLPKPAIAGLVLDSRLQQLPIEGSASGVKNLTYVDVSYTAARPVQQFHQLIPFRRLAVLVHPGLLEAIPELRELGGSAARQLGVTLTFVPVRGSAADALRAIPEDADAAYLTAIDELPAAGVDSLLSGLAVRRVPTFSFAPRPEIERSVLASYSPKDDAIRRGRRIAGTLQRIRNGEDAGTLPVGLPSAARLTLNLQTARAIGYTPDWKTLTEADLLHEQPPGAGPTWSLSSVAREALRVNLDLLVAERQVASGKEDVRKARGALLPQIQASATGTAVREETAARSLGQQAERRGDGQLALSQVLVSDQTWATYANAGHAQEGRVAERRRTQLDVVLDAVTAYLNVLRAKAIAKVERANVRTTRSNLELAELRERTGASSMADVYRWQAELAQGRRTVIKADSRVQIAQVELNRILNRPLEEPFITEETTAADSALTISEPRIFGYFSNPESFRIFRDFTVQEGLAASPELRAIDARIAAQKRTRVATGRAFWLPTVSLQGAASDVFYRGGAGADPPSIGGLTIERPPDLSWSLQLKASIPIFTGFQRTAARSQATIELERLELERRAIDLVLSSRIRSALHQAGASWAGIEQAQAAALAARRNVELVTDGYSRGAVSIITLLDAQQAALEADEAAANAMYDFLADLMQVQRASGQFDFFASAEEREGYFHRLDDFYRAAGVSPARGQ